MSRQSCPHLQNIVQTSATDLCLQKKGKLCMAKDCFQQGPNLWLCLQQQCLFIGCSDKHNDHSTLHFESNRNHCIQMNLSSQRVWCYLCESEVFLQNQNNRYHQQRVNSFDSSDSARRIFQYNDRGGGGGSDMGRNYDSSEYDEDEVDLHGPQLNGLVGLKNVANTCYMNSAIQALSNSPPLTGYFLECGNIVQHSISRSKIGLAKSYHRLIRDMWLNQRRGYIVPDEIIRGISTIHPMFRGYQQHDTQEFLRCFMDQLHEELKEVTPPPPESYNRNEEEMNVDSSPCPSPSSLSQSEAEEYETCDSGVSEQSSLSDEMTHNNTIRSKITTTPPPLSSSSSLPSLNQRSNASIPTMGSSILTNRTGSNASLTSQSGQQQQQAKENTTKVIHRSIISDIFDGKLLSSVQCLTCDRVSTREETFQDLSLPIPHRDYLAVLHQSQNNSSGVSINNSIGSNSSNSVVTGSCSDVVYHVQDNWMWWFWNWFRSWFWGPAVTLHDCMAAFFSADELKGDNMYSCEKCNKLRNGLKFSRVLALPEMLCVHLKRFRHDLSYSSKISSPVIFPLTGLDMRQYLHKDCKSKVSTYDLTAVICHHGTVGSGHYICYAKHFPTERWFEYDDQTVTQVSAETVQNCEAYVLFYQKQNPQMQHVRIQAQEILNSIPYTYPASSDIKFYISKQWLNRFNTFAEPGPIDNWSILCQHGNLLPNKAANLSDLLVPLPQPLWEYLYEQYGGGPATNYAVECDTCKTRAEDLQRRQKNELLLFSELRDEFQYQDNSSMLFAISMAWFRKWQAFARCETSEEPSPINNTAIALQCDTLPIRNVRPGSDYAQINLKLWKFFFNIYGGGPEIVLRGASEFTKVEKETDLADTTENLSLNDDNESDTIDMNETIVEQDVNVKQEIVIEENDESIDEATKMPSLKDTSTSIIKPAKTVSFEDTKDLSESDMDDNSVSQTSEEKSMVINVTTTAVISHHDFNGGGAGDSRVRRNKKSKATAYIKPLDAHRRRHNNNHLFGAEGTIRYIPDEDSINNNSGSENATQKAKRNGIETMSSDDDEEVAELTAKSEHEKQQRWNNKKKSKSIRMK